jgi:hypothetical protein
MARTFLGPGSESRADAADAARRRLSVSMNVMNVERMLIGHYKCGIKFKQAT